MQPWTIPRMPHDPPVVFVVDDDSSVRKSLEFLIEPRVGTETFGSAWISSRGHVMRAVLPDARCLSAGPQWARSAGARRRSDRDAGHLHHRLWGRAHDGPRDESWSRGVPDEALVDEALLAAIQVAINRSRAENGHAARSASCRLLRISQLPRARSNGARLSGRLNKQVGISLESARSR